MWNKTKAAISGRKPEEVNIQYTDKEKALEDLKEAVEKQQAAANTIRNTYDNNTYTSHRYNYVGSDIRESIAKDTDIQMLLIDVLNKFNETGEVEGPEWKKLIKEITQYKEKKMN